MKELEIKRIVIQNLLKSGGVDVVTHEFSFDFGRCRADLVCIKDGEIYGYEIKSAFDRTARLSGQLESYFSLFDYVNVVCDGKHVQKVKEAAPIRTGILVCENGGLTKKRAPKKIMKQNELVVLDAMPMSFLRYHFSVSAKSKFDLCQKIKSNYSRESIKDGFKKYLHEKMGAQTRLLKNEVNEVVTLDDFYSLGLPEVNLG